MPDGGAARSLGESRRSDCSGQLCLSESFEEARLAGVADAEGFEAGLKRGPIVVAIRQGMQVAQDGHSMVVALRLLRLDAFLDLGPCGVLAHSESIQAGGARRLGGLSLAGASGIALAFVRELQAVNEGDNE